MGRGRLTLAALTALLMLQAAVLAPIASAYSPDCACCPGDAMAADCASTCATTATSSAVPVPAVRSPATAITPRIDRLALTQVYTPPHPPPIR